MNLEDALNPYLTAWNLTDAQPLATTATSHVYTAMHRGETVVLKLLTPVGVHDEQHGPIALQCYDGQGAVRLIRHDDGAHLLEYVDGPDLMPMVQRGDDDGATAIIADVLNTLHKAHHTDASALISLGRRFRSLFTRADADGTASIYVRAARVAETLISQPEREAVLHGDIHHENIRHSARRGWLAIDPKGVYGDRAFDVANALCNPVSMPALVQDEARLLHHAAIYAAKLDIERARILKYVFAYACLSACWSVEDGEDPAHSLRMAELAEPYVV